MCLPIKVRNPSCVLAEGEHNGFEWAIVHNGIGYRCGYIRVPPGHPWHGRGYDDVDAKVHGGLTFAAADEPCDKGGPDDAWWLGFDCAHNGDAPDPELPGDSVSRSTLSAMNMMSSLFGYGGGSGEYGTIKSTEYVRTECESLCEQAGNASFFIANSSDG